MDQHLIEEEIKMYVGFIDITQNKAIGVDDKNNKTLLVKDNDKYSFKEILEKLDNLEKLKDKLNESIKKRDKLKVNFQIEHMLFKIIYTLATFIVSISSVFISINLLLSNLYLFSVIWLIPAICGINTLGSDTFDYIKLIKEYKDFKKINIDINTLEEYITKYQSFIESIKNEVNYKEILDEDEIKKEVSISKVVDDTIIFDKVNRENHVINNDDTIKLVKVRLKRVDK